MQQKPEQPSAIKIENQARGPLSSSPVSAQQPAEHARSLFTKPYKPNPEDLEQTQPVLLEKQFVPREAQSLKIEVLKDNTELMSVALDDMRKTREEERRRLNER